MAPALWKTFWVGFFSTLTLARQLERLSKDDKRTERLPASRAPRRGVGEPVQECGCVCQRVFPRWAGPKHENNWSIYGTTPQCLYHSSTSQVSEAIVFLFMAFDSTLTYYHALACGKGETFVEQ